MIQITEFKSLIELGRRFPDEKTCVEHVEAIRWNGNNPELFAFGDCHKIAMILEVDTDKVIDLTREETRPRKRRTK
jgi:hypothetical protein